MQLVYSTTPADWAKNEGRSKHKSDKTTFRIQLKSIFKATPKEDQK